MKEQRKTVYKQDMISLRYPLFRSISQPDVLNDKENPKQNSIIL